MSLVTRKTRETLERDGVAVIKGVFGSQECDAMKFAALDAQRYQNPKYPHRYLEMSPAGKPALIFWPALINDTLLQYRNDPRLAEIVRAFLGDDVKQLNNQVYFRSPGDGDQFAWHQDVCFRQPPERYPGIESGYLQTIIALEDIGEDNAPVEFIPGSHKSGVVDTYGSAAVTKMLREFKRQGLDGVKYTASKGDVLVWSVLTVHGSEPNDGKRTRTTFMNGFARADAALDWPYYLKGGEVVPEIDHTLIP